MRKVGNPRDSPLSSPGTTPFADHQRVADEVHDDQYAHDQKLCAAREADWIDDGAQVVSDEALTVRALAGEIAEVVLERLNGQMLPLASIHTPQARAGRCSHNIQRFHSTRNDPSSAKAMNRKWIAMTASAASA